MKTSFIASLLLISLAFSAQAQLNNYTYNRKITGVNSTWHKIEIPAEMFAKTKANLHDIRIYGINKNDTFEAPYFVEIDVPKVIENKIPFSIINSSSIQNNYFYTFKMNELREINKIELNFSNTNFDWNVKLEGSNDNTDWFTISENTRILSINNSETNYSFTHLNFKTSQYTYYRISINSKIKPELQSAHITSTKTIEHQTNKYEVVGISQSFMNKISSYEIDLKYMVPVSQISIEVLDKVDYYRRLNISVVSDSTKSEKGMTYHYTQVYTGTLSSLEKSDFKLNNVKCKKLKIEIQNLDNQPLQLGKFNVFGNRHYLIGRYNKAGNYYLAYGNATATAPQYDITAFKDKIPSEMSSLILEQENIGLESDKTHEPEENKIWLWIIMGVIIILLGSFTIKMIKSQESGND